MCAKAPPDSTLALPNGAARTQSQTDLILSPLIHGFARHLINFDDSRTFVSGYI
jgi:hypothetical protein